MAMTTAHFSPVQLHSFRSPPVAITAHEKKYQQYDVHKYTYHEDFPSKKGFLNILRKSTTQNKKGPYIFCTLHRLSFNHR
jgi:hypothetical protein